MTARAVTHRWLRRVVRDARASRRSDTSPGSGLDAVLSFRVPRGGFVLLDVHGTTHDPAYWPNPDAFDPERLRADYPDEALIPQGGGDRATGHRCPGDDLTLTILQVSVRRLARSPRPDTAAAIGYDATRVPTRPQLAAPTRNWSPTAATRRALLSLATRFLVQGSRDQPSSSD